MQTKLMFPRALRYLLAVAEHKSFTRAADALCISQPTLSQQIKHLEEALGIQLLDRSSRVVQLTDAGQVYLVHARRALEELDAGQRAITEVADLTRGSLRLGMTPVTEYLTTALLDAFGARYPGIHLQASEMSQDLIEAGVAENTLDVGVVAFTHAGPSDAWSSRIETQTLYMEPLSLVVGATHPLAGRTTAVSPSVFEEEPMALLNGQFALRRHFDLYALEKALSPRVVVESNSLGMIIQAVGQGRLVTVLPTTIAESQPRLRALSVAPDLPHYTIALVSTKGAYHSPACQAFVRLASAWNFSSGAQAGANADPAPGTKEKPPAGASPAKRSGVGSARRS